MRGTVVAAIFVVLLVAIPAAGASSSSSSGGSMTATASPHTARAHGVRLVLTLRYRMHCGYPGEGLLVVTFPSAMKLPKRFATGSVRLAGKSIAARIDGRTASMTVPAPTSTLCNAIGPGAVTLTFSHAAKLVNPARAGAYRVKAAHIGHAFTAMLTIGPAT